MAFPVSPVNGQTTVVNQITYQYSSATNSWTRLVSTANVISANTIAVNGALTVGTTISGVGNISTAAYFVGDGRFLTNISANAITVSNIVNGTTSISIGTSGGNANVSVGGTSNVVVWATTGEYVTGVVSASGDVTGGNVLTGGLVSATGTLTGSSVLGSVISASANITGGNVLTGGLVSATGTVTGSSLLGSVVSASQHNRW
jgi:hypothetical protein